MILFLQFGVWGLTTLSIILVVGRFIKFWKEPKHIMFKTGEWLPVRRTAFGAALATLGWEPQTTQHVKWFYRLRL